MQWKQKYAYRYSSLPSKMELWRTVLQSWNRHIYVHVTVWYSLIIMFDAVSLMPKRNTNNTGAKVYNQIPLLKETYPAILPNS
jgi:hypothetical protein